MKDVIQIYRIHSSFGSLYIMHGDVEIRCGYGSSQDEAILVFRLNKQPITPTLRATWTDLKNDPELSWVCDRVEVCDSCIRILIKNKDIEFRFTGDDRISEVYPTYCDLCDKYFDDIELKDNPSSHRCDIIMYHPEIRSDWGGDGQDYAGPFLSNRLMIRDYRRINEFLSYTEDKLSLTWDLYKSLLVEYVAPPFCLGKSKRHFGRLCTRCIHNHLWGNKNMDKTLQKEIYDAYVEMQSRPNGELYREAHTSFDKLKNLFVEQGNHQQSQNTYKTPLFNWEKIFLNTCI